MYYSEFYSKDNVAPEAIKEFKELNIEAVVRNDDLIEENIVSNEADDDSMEQNIISNTVDNDLVAQNIIFDEEIVRKNDDSVEQNFSFDEAATRTYDSTEQNIISQEIEIHSSQDNSYQNQNINNIDELGMDSEMENDDIECNDKSNAQFQEKFGTLCYEKGKFLIINPISI